MRLLLLTYFLLNRLLLNAVFAQSEDGLVLTYDQFIEIVKSHHPLAFQANLQTQRGEAFLLRARGAFDPRLDAELKQKYFDGKQYYSLLHGGLKVPTWFGLTAQAGYEANEGNYLNPRDFVPDDGLWYAGLSLSLGRGLLLDERRAELKQARLYNESAKIEQDLMLNELIFDASLAYWSWFAAHEQLVILKEGLNVAKERFNGILRSAELGDRAYIDTLEASIQVTNREIALKQGELKWINSRDKLSVYLWEEGFVPLELDLLTRPVSADDVDLPRPVMDDFRWRDSLIQDHPLLLQMKYKLDSKRIDVRMKEQQLLPRLDLKYNALLEAGGTDFLSGYNAQNYNWGIQFAYPILSRKDRGSLRLSKIEMESMAMDQLNKSAEITFKITAALNAFSNSADQVLLYRSIVRDNYLLFLGEKNLFDRGESSLFLLNTREQAWIDSRIKHISAIRDNQVASRLSDYELIRIR